MLIRGDGDGAGYLLVNPPTEPWLSSPDKQVTPSVLGTSGDYATIFYWLDGHGDLKQQVGHKVEFAATGISRSYELTVASFTTPDRATTVEGDHPGSQGRCGARAHAGGDVLVAVWYLNGVQS